MRKDLAGTDYLKNVLWAAPPDGWLLPEVGRSLVESWLEAWDEFYLKLGTLGSAT
jgi:hypothetical protein